MKNTLLIIFLISIVNLYSQHPNDNWRVYINSDTIPVELRSDTAYITYNLNPETDFLTLVKKGVNPEKGKIQFISGKGQASEINFPIPLTNYKTGVPVVVRLKKVSRNYKSNVINGLDIQIIEITNRVILPIIFIKFIKAKI